MRPIAISCGHEGTPGDMGAYNKKYGVWEHKVVKELAMDIAAELEDSGIPVAWIPVGSLPAKIREINSYDPLFSVEIHLNGYFGIASGTECLYWHNSRDGLRLAIRLRDRIVEALGLRDRGVKPIKSTEQRGGVYLGFTSCPAVITESLFIDNDGDCELLLSPGIRGEIETAHVEAIKSFYQEIE